MPLSSPARCKNTATHFLHGRLSIIVCLLLLSLTFQVSAFAQTPPPAAPTVSGATTTPGTPRITVTWNAVATASYYTVHRSYVNGGYTHTNTWTTVDTLLENNNVSNNVTYTYYVTAHNGSLVSPNSNAVSATATLDAPQPTATTSNGKVTVSWGAVTGATSYSLYRSNTGGNDYWVINGGTGTSFDGGNVGNGNTYYFKVRAFNGGGYGSYSGVAAIYVDLSAPSGVTAARVPVDKATISWGSVPDAIRYDLYRGTNPSSYGNFMMRTSGAGTSYLDTNVYSSQTYYYYVQAYSNAGAGRKSMIVGTDGSVMPCPPTEQCTVPMDRPISGEAGASFDDPVNLATGAESLTHAPDLSVYNPSGPSAIWQRQYFSYLGIKGYASPGLSQGWAHTYDVFLQAPAGAWGALKLNYYNGAVETLTPVLDGSGQPTGAFSVPVGSPYFVSGVAGATTGEWESVTITWRNQAQWRFTLLSSGTYPLSRISNRMGGGINLSWSGSRALTLVTDVASSATLLTLSYGGNGMVASVTDAYNRQVVYGYSIPFSAAPGMLQSVSQVVAAGTTNPPAKWSYGYTVNGQLLNTISVPNPAGSGTSTATINYDLLGRVTSLVDANGNQRIYTYGTSSTVVQVKNAANTVVQSWTQKFNAQRNTGITDANNKSTVAEYNDLLNPSKVTRVVDKNNKETLYTYDQHGNVLTVTNPRNITTTYTWSYTAFPLGRLTSVQVSSKPATTFSYYEPSGLLQSITSPSPAGSSTVTSTFTYDTLGNILTATGPGNNATSQIVTTYNYTTDGTYTQVAKVGQPLTITDNLGIVTHARYDTQGRVISMTDALGYETNTSYNLIGQPEEIQLPASGQTGTGRGRNVNSYLYTGGPLLTTTFYDESNAQVRQVANSYGLEGELLSVTSSTEPVSYTYDALYRIKTLKDGNNNTTTYNYNSIGYVSSVQMPGGQTIQFTSYDFEGNLLQRIDGNNVTTNYIYNDAESLLTDIQYPATPSLNVHFGYDSYGRLSSMTDGSGSHSYVYGNTDELQSATTTYTGLPAQTISYAYYANGSRQSMTTPAGTFSYSYDSAGRPTSMANPFSETSSWTYFNNNRLNTQTLSNGTQTTYSYNALGQMVDLVTKTGGGGVLSQFTNLVHDGAGNRTQMTATIPAAPSLSGLTSYLYDTKNQLTQEQTMRSGGITNTFGYDSAGNPTNFKGTTKTYNSNNQQTATGFGYDGNGNPTTYNGTSLTFDPENQLTAYGGTMTAGYRGDGLRAWKQTSAGRTYFLYDGLAPVVEIDSTGAVLATRTSGPHGLISRRANMQSSFYTFDPQGSVAQSLDSTGAILSSHHFTASGAELTTASTDPFGYKAQWGYYTDRETGLLLLTHRYYDTQSGRFLTRDPISYEGGINLYSYVENNPVNFADPTGLEKFHGDLGSLCRGDCEDIKRGIRILESSIPDRSAELSRRKRQGLPINAGHTGRLAAERRKLEECRRRYKQLGCDSCSSPPTPVPVPVPHRFDGREEEQRLMQQADRQRAWAYGSAGAGAIVIAVVIAPAAAATALIFALAP